jgi:hypothetical protein
MVEYVLERLLYGWPNLQPAANTSSSKADCSWLTSAHGARRATRDIDILGQASTANDTEITRRIRTIAATDVDDWVAFDSAILKTVPIRDDGLYYGLRPAAYATISRRSALV